MSKLLRCGHCREIEYCSVECQREHWHEHKARCKTFTKRQTLANALLVFAKDTVCGTQRGFYRALDMHNETNFFFS